jgi:hypothetical protein
MYPRVGNHVLWLLLFAIVYARLTLESVVGTGPTDRDRGAGRDGEHRGAPPAPATHWPERATVRGRPTRALRPVATHTDTNR